MKLRRVPVLVCALLGACASVSTEVALFNPAQHYPPSQNVEILQQEPSRPFVRIALLEATGVVGGSETSLLEGAREKARAIGADALVTVETTCSYQEPVTVWDPWWPPRSAAYESRGRYYQSYPYAPTYYGSTRTLPGGTIYRLKAYAIKYQ